jgi:hypothetical protein
MPAARCITKNVTHEIDDAGRVRWRRAIPFSLRRPLSHLIGMLSIMAVATVAWICCAPKRHPIPGSLADW